MDQRDYTPGKRRMALDTGLCIVAFLTIMALSFSFWLGTKCGGERIIHTCESGR